MPKRSPRVPLVLQMEGAECGAACLAMVLAAHGCPVPLRELRVATTAARDGARATNLIQAATLYGFEGAGYSVELEKLRELPRPAILFWDFRHFVVLERASARHVDIVDPAIGRRRVPLAEAAQRFTGVALIVSPGPTAQRRPAPDGTWRRLWRRLTGMRAVLALTFLVAIGAAILPLVAARGVSVLIDEVVTAGRRDWAGWILGAIAGTALFAAALQGILTTLVRRLESAIALTTATRTMHRLLFLPLGFFQARTVGDLAGRLGHGDMIAGTIGGAVLGGMAGALVTVAGLAFLARLHPPLAIAVGAIGLGVLAIARLQAPVVAEAARQAALRRAEYQAGLAQSLPMSESFRAHGREDILFQRSLALATSRANAEQRLAGRQALLRAVPVLAGALGQLATLVIGALAVMKGAISLGDLAAAQLVTGTTLAPLGALTGAVGATEALAGALDRLEDIEETAPVDPLPDMVAPEAGRPVLALRDIAYAPSPIAPALLRDVTLDIAAGEMVAVSGPSGCGKSTLLRVVAGLLPPDRGRRLLFGIEAGGPAPGLVGYVDQAPVVFGGPLMDSITLWHPAPASALIAEAIRLSGLDEVVAGLPQGLDTHVAEDGRSLSRGQVQRVAIARALLFHPRLLILDEATSALDAESERRLMARLRAAGMAVLFVTHHRETLALADRVAELREGRLWWATATPVAVEAAQ